MAVALGPNAWIEDRHEAGVGASADQPADSLLELDDRFGDLIVHERVAAVGANRFEPRFEQRLVRHTERQLRDNDVLQCVTRNIDSLPETVGSEENSRRIGSKFFEHQ